MKINVSKTKTMIFNHAEVIVRSHFQILQCQIFLKIWNSISDLKYYIIFRTLRRRIVCWRYNLTLNTWISLAKNSLCISTFERYNFIQLRRYPVIWNDDDEDLRLSSAFQRVMSDLLPQTYFKIILWRHKILI